MTVQNGILTRVASFFSGGGASTAVLERPVDVVVDKPIDIKQPVAVDLEDGPVPLNTHGVGKAGKEPPFVGTEAS